MGRSLPSVIAMTTELLTQIPVRVDIDAAAPGFTKALNHLDAAAERELDAAGIAAGLRELLRLRVSQLNGCAYCVDMHSQTARAAGEPQQRLDALPVWRETPFFTGAERAALAFAEAMARMADDHVPDRAYAAVTEHYGRNEIASLVALVVSVSAWNAVGASTRAWPPGSYRP